ncbi:DUF3515 domain-containing protein [Nocardia sp. NPDC127526]|uniref:DUF3515 domain-containing protein n=1 Tax=Nocardia sp. NPDC127526 TaxID=3345393 RepID=UPI003633C9A0
MSNDTRGSEPESTKPDTTGDPAGTSAAAPAAATGANPGESAAPAGSSGRPDATGAETKAADNAVHLGKSEAEMDSTPGPDAESESGADASKSGTNADSKSEADADGESVSTEPSDEDYSPRRSPALIATAAALPVALVVGVLVAGVLANRNPVREPLALGAVDAPGATGPACSALLPELPEKIGDYTAAELRQPAPAATKAWQLPEGGEPIVLRCGLGRPLEFHRASPLQVVNGVSWFEVKDPTSGATSGTWFAVDRGTYIALTMANDAGPTPLQEVSDAIAKTIPQQDLDPNPLPN